MANLKIFKSFTPLYASFLMYATKERIQIAGLLALSFFNGVFQVVGIVSIMPFIAVISEPSIVEHNQYIIYLQNFIGLQSEASLLIFFGTITFLSIVVSNLFSVLEYWATLKFFNHHEHLFSVRLLTILLNEKMVNFYKLKKSDILKFLLSDVERLLVGSQMALIGLFSDLLLFSFIFSLLLFLDFWVTLSATLLLVLSYVSIFILLSKKIQHYGESFTELESKVFAATNQAIDLFREIRISGKNREFINKFSGPAEKLAEHGVKYYLLSFLPVQLVEVLAFLVAIVVSLYYIIADTSSINAITSITVFAFATYRLLPILKSLFEGVETLTFNKKTLNNLLDIYKVSPKSKNTRIAENIKFKESISFDNVSFSYNNASKNIVDNLNLTFYKNEFTCLSGFSGAGKSTVTHLLLGLHEPTTGRILIDDTPLQSSNILAWQTSVGYVPQKVQLVNGNVYENIAFGENPKEVDKEKVKRAASIAAIDFFIMNNLPNKYDTILGDGGVTISGGEKQRIGIARSLYNDPELLIFDEATNELDSTTELEILESIKSLGNKTLIFISHKPFIIEYADKNIIIQSSIDIENKGAKHID